MRRRGRRADRLRGQDGVVLIGVIMFVLALTILGLSLFSLSSYESQFMLTARSKDEALYAAQGGLEIVTTVLSVSPYSLRDAHQAEGLYGITRAVAWQVRVGGRIDSTGTVTLGAQGNPDTVVYVRVTAARAGVSRTLQATYRPIQRKDPYRRLFTIAGGPGSVLVNTIGYGTPPPPGDGRDLTVWLAGKVWQNVSSATDTAWAAHVNWNPRLPFEVNGVPAPDVAGYLASHPAQYTAVLRRDATGEGSEGGGGFEVDSLYFTRHSSSAPGYYGSPATLKAGYSFWDNPQDLYIAVGTGIAVWLLPSGFASIYRTHVSAIGGPATLVMVARSNTGTDDPGVGAAFDGSIVADANVRIIVVSDAEVDIEDINQATAAGSVPYLAVYANELHLSGPRRTSGNAVSLAYDPAVMDPIIDDLIARGALPLTTNAQPTAYTRVPDSWQDLTP